MLLIHGDKGKLHFADGLDVSKTVEKPNGDVKIGILDAVKGLQAQTGINIPCPRIARLEVYNLLGEKVAALVDCKQKAGYKIARWDAGSLSSGSTATGFRLEVLCRRGRWF